MACGKYEVASGVGIRNNKKGKLNSFSLLEKKLYFLLGRNALSGIF